SADGSWGFPPVRVGRRQAILKRSAILGWSFFCVYKMGKSIEKNFKKFNGLSNRWLVIVPIFSWIIYMLGLRVNSDFITTKKM
ncbi:hypothetical protein ACFWMS_28360, partial [Peribacillus butanolivorans]|uniref:hypothetical protein n=1 Tax=Peribacillus butanolivorans TaxID=421767 RepID=UPI0036576A0F